MLNIFIKLFGYLRVSWHLCKNVFHNTAPFLKLGLFFFFAIYLCESLYIFDISLLSETWFTNSFPYSIGCIFIFFIFSFAVQKLSSLL
jgi:hypothetical protein